ncbi:hypothetical protein FHS82_004004 [Pseudochelatococcus lubricantis]|uniref:Uncharacterized protein n=1 Tax=Pseudochelatococcus lubricantis TaxID=1538102 RepID=A0ABX0V4J3_9HYPH|nr:hypothetical protein [Pseudochelatococcus lubricantis]NIJ60137.1 hypothetical protein [Pseudochelatococcus lubricantis]
MQFNRSELNASAISLARGTDADESCVGYNYLIEENISDPRRDDVETYEPLSDDVREVVNGYFVDSVQGLVRGHNSSTFDEATNDLALLPATVEPVQKIIRLERIDRHLEPQGGLDFGSLVDALRTCDQHRLSALTDQFQNYPGERPSFAAFKSEVSDDLKEADWLQRIIDRLGLYHHYPFVSGNPYRFALMEYTADEVIKQAHSKGVDRCFSLATVLECQDNPAFFPVPRSTSHGFTVDLRERNPKKPSVREILHIRFDYSWRNVKRLVKWSGADVPDIEAARGRHLDTLRTETGRTDFGEVGI